MNQIIQSPVYVAPAFIAFILKAYDVTYDWNRPMSDFFQEPYASELPGLLNGTKNRRQIDKALTDTLAKLFNPTFFAELKDPTQSTPLKEKLKENSFLNWYPKSPTRLYHGTHDHIVPFITGKTTYSNFEADGAPNVTFTPISGGTHESSIIPAVLNALLWIMSIDK